MDRTECKHGHLRRKCLICDLQEELAAEKEHAADAEAESVKLLERLAAEREKKETAYREVEAQVRKVQKAEATLAAIRTDLDTHYRDPGHCDLTWFLSRVQGHVGYEPEGQRGE